MNYLKKLPVLFVLTAMLIFASGCLNKNKSSDSNPYNLDLTQTIEEYNRQVDVNPQMRMIDLGKTIKGIVLDIRYATAKNFTGKKIYTAPKAFARKPVAEALQKVQDSLSFYNIGLKIYDAYRPYAATMSFFKVYPDTNFVANPRYGSRHNRGCAVDITLVELSSGKEIPMPTEFDNFTSKAYPEYTDLPDTVLANRKFLFGIMSYFGFTHYPTEWWHFDFKGWENYKLMDLSFAELEKVTK